MTGKSFLRVCLLLACVVLLVSSGWQLATHFLFANATAL